MSSVTWVPVFQRAPVFHRARVFQRAPVSQRLSVSQRGSEAPSPVATRRLPADARRVESRSRHTPNRR
jgi:hypothetical protein